MWFTYWMNIHLGISWIAQFIIIEYGPKRRNTTRLFLNNVPSILQARINDIHALCIFYNP